MLIIIVAAALVAMTTYITRSMNARLKSAQSELDYYKLQNDATASAASSSSPSSSSPLPSSYWTRPTGTTSSTSTGSTPLPAEYWTRPTGNTASTGTTTPVYTSPVIQTGIVHQGTRTDTLNTLPQGSGTTTSPVIQTGIVHQGTRTDVPGTLPWTNSENK